MPGRKRFRKLLGVMGVAVSLALLVLGSGLALGQGAAFQRTVQASPSGNRIIQGSIESSLSIIKICVEGRDTKVRWPGHSTFYFEDEVGLGWQRCLRLDVPINLGLGDELLCVGTGGQCTIEVGPPRIEPPDLESATGGAIIRLYKGGRFQSRAKASPSGNRMIQGKVNQPFTITELCTKGRDTQIYLEGVGPFRRYPDECVELAKPLNLPSGAEFVCVGRKDGECMIRGRMR